MSPQPPQTMQDLINLQATDAQQVATDQTTITSDQAKLAADQAQLGTDQGTQTNDAATFQTALGLSGPVASPTPDGTGVIIYAAPGAVVPIGEEIPLASSVPVPALPAPVTSGS